MLLSFRETKIRKDDNVFFAVFEIGFRTRGSGTQPEWLPPFNLPYTLQKKVTNFRSPSGVSLTKLSLAGNNLIIPLPGRVWFVTSRLGDGKISKLFYSVISSYLVAYLYKAAGGGGMEPYTVHEEQGVNLMI